VLMGSITLLLPYCGLYRRDGFCVLHPRASQKLISKDLNSNE